MPVTQRLNLFREPLIQFLILGAMLFAVDAYVLANRDDPRRIVIDDERVAELIAIFKEGQGREPSPQEVQNLIIKWSQNEILYREAQQLRMDQGDEMIRNRLILKMRNVLFNRVVVDAPSPGELEEFFEFNRQRYDTPARYDLEVVPLTDPALAQQAGQLARELNTGTLTLNALDNPVHNYESRPRSNLEALFGDAAIAPLLDDPGNDWQVVEHDRERHLVRVVARYPAQPAQLEQVKSQVIRHWKQFSNEMQLADQTKAMADRYRIRLDLSREMSERLPEDSDASRIHQISDRFRPADVMVN
ncbi:MAG: hypothetical protein CML06_06115 [Pseudomonadales bacterium]|nr:hypothetical protein [Pseudomonadales bacterium]